MRRLKYPPKPNPEPTQAALALETAVAAMGTKRKRKPSSKAMLDGALGEAELFRSTGDWSTAKGKHFVALYAWLHSSIYETEAVDLLDGKSMLAASNAADKMFRVDFGGDGKRFVEFIAWCWARERQAVKKGTGARRLSWRLQFASRHLLVDYRVDLMRCGR